MNKGFSLVELIVVVAIIATIIGSSVAIYNSGNSEQSVRRDVENFVDTLTIARNKTIAKDGGTYTCNKSIQYYIQLDTITTYSLHIRCTNTVGGVDQETTSMIATYNLSGSQFDTGESVVEFLYPYGTVERDIPIDIRGKRSDKCTTVSITSIGTIDTVDYEC